MSKSNGTTLNASPRAQGLSLKQVAQAHPNLDNKAQCAVWKYGSAECIAVASGTDSGTLRGMAREAARHAGLQLGGAALAEPSSPYKPGTLSDRLHKALHTDDDLIGEAPAPKAKKYGPVRLKEARNAKPYSAAHTARFTEKQLATMAEIAASARKHASK